MGSKGLSMRWKFCPALETKVIAKTKQQGTASYLTVSSECIPFIRKINASDQKEEAKNKEMLKIWK